MNSELLQIFVAFLKTIQNEGQVRDLHVSVLHSRVDLLEGLCRRLIANDLEDSEERVAILEVLDKAKTGEQMKMIMDKHLDQMDQLNAMIATFEQGGKLPDPDPLPDDED